MSDTEAIKKFSEQFQLLKAEVGKVIVGQEDVVNEILYAIFGGGHALLIGVPGLAKTLLVNTVSKALGLGFKRIQFTPDLMPSDIIGSEILDENRHFKYLKGPIFANIILADEINRTPPKTQAALLEAMQERSVTVAGQVNQLPQPFFVLATQNPIEQEGTYPLPEAQLDRFMFSIELGYPNFQEEVEVVKRTTSSQTTQVTSLFTESNILNYQKLIQKLPVSDNVVEYAVKLVSKTRPGGEFTTDFVNDFMSWGAGPRASQNLIIAAKVHAAVQGKFSPDIEDVKAVALPVLRHRIVKNYKAEAEGITIDTIIEKIL